MTRRADQVAIQIARRQLGMEDGDYRAMLHRITRKSSSKLLTAAEVGAVLEELKRLGFQPDRTRSHRKRSPRPHVRKVYKLWWRLADCKAVKSGHRALNAFIAAPTFQAKWGEQLTDAEFLTVERAQDVIEALKDIARRKGVRLAP